MFAVRPACSSGRGKYWLSRAAIHPRPCRERRAPVDGERRDGKRWTGLAGSYYGLVGNGTTAALIGPDASVSWLCLPRFDGPPLVASALDPKRGGSWRFLVNGRSPRPLNQSYRGASNVLLTRATARNGDIRLRVADWMPWGGAGLSREVLITNASAAPVRVEWSAPLAPVRSALFPWKRGSAPALPRPQVCVLAGEPAVAVALAGRTSGCVDLRPGGRARVRLGLGYGTTAAEAAWAASAMLCSDAATEVAFWRDWLAGGHPQPVASPALKRLYTRSLLALKLMQYTSGAFVAAVTASLPATPLGSDNWDYRFCWLRDGCYSASALDRAGFHAEARRFYEFALGLQTASGEWPQPLVTVDGLPPDEVICADLRGPRGEGPIRFGNAAARQVQLDSAGHVIHGLYEHAQLTGDRAWLRRVWPHVRRGADWVVVNWSRSEHGIWEFRERTSHWVHGKTLCWVALDRASRIAGDLGHVRFARRYAGEAERVARDVLNRGWNDGRRAFLQTYDADAPLDASVLALEEYGLLPADDPRFRATLDAFGAFGSFSADRVAADGARGLNMWGAFTRYERAAFPFYLPTLWVARALAHSGDARAARRLLHLCARCATDLGLMAEHFDPRTGEQHGNFPQAFSHEEWIRAQQDVSARA